MSSLFRTLLIFFGALVVHSGSHQFNMLHDSIEYPFLIAITPYLISLLPLLGTRKLMEGNFQPLVSLLLLAGLSFCMYYLVNYVKYNKQTDFVSIFLNKNDISIGFLKINRVFVIVLALVLLIELISQHLSKSIAKQDRIKEFEKAVTRSLAKFFADKK